MDTSERLMKIYTDLYEHFGPQGWWPGETAFEIAIGAILTQNTAWSNVEKAIGNLKGKKLLDPYRLDELSSEELATLIRPAGYYNIKAKRIKNFIKRLIEDFEGSLNTLFALDLQDARKWLLSISGIGPETADSILLYAGEKPIFVVDAYTYRVLSRHEIIFGDESYEEVQEIFQKNLINDVKFFNEFHALFVAVGKHYCVKNKPRCALCPIRTP